MTKWSISLKGLSYVSNGLFILKQTMSQSRKKIKNCWIWQRRSAMIQVSWFCNSSTVFCFYFRTYYGRRKFLPLFQFPELMMKAKEDELNSIIMELRKNLEALQAKFAKEEVDRLVIVLRCTIKDCIIVALLGLAWTKLLNELLGSIGFFG